MRGVSVSRLDAEKTFDQCRRQSGDDVSEVKDMRRCLISTAFLRARGWMRDG